MTRALMVMGAAVLAGTALIGQQRPAAASLDKARLEAAINKEVIDGDLKAAIAMYQELTRSTDRTVAAQSYLRLGQGYKRLGDPQAKPTLQRALEFKDQPQVVAKARVALGLRAQAGGGATAPSMRRVWEGKGVDTSGAVSPDGRTIAYVDPDTGDLGVRDLEAGASRRLTSNGNEEWTEFSESAVWSRTTTQKDGIVRMWVIGHQAPDVGVNDSVHRTAERLARLNPAVVEPAPRRALLHLTVGRFSGPGDVAPENRFMKWRPYPDGPRVNTVIEEHNERSPPEPSHGDRDTPSARLPQFMCCKVQPVDLGFSQVMSSRHIPLRWRCGKSW